MAAAIPKEIWAPDPDTIQRANLTRYMDWLAQRRQPRFSDYQALWRWSVTDLAGFWASIWDYFEVGEPNGYEAVLTQHQMPGAHWFPGAEVSYAARALRRRDDHPALVSRSEARGLDRLETISYRELARQVAAARRGLQKARVKRGDRVVAYLPNTPEAVVALLAAASLGATWSSCSPDFGARAVIDRFRQIEPKVLLAVDGYRYNGRAHDRLEEVGGIRSALPSLTATVVVPYLDGDRSAAALPRTQPWDELLADPGELEFDAVPFEHPLWVLYSSGTTGLPKGLVHGHGGVLLEHLKSLAFHQDLGQGDRFFWFTTTGWMMWNYVVGSLLLGSTAVLFDGSPGYPDLGTLWRLADDAGVTYFGTSAPYIQSCMKDGIEPRAGFDLSRVRAIGSTGAPLPPEGFEWVAERVKTGIPVASVSGGTDCCTAFVQSCPLLPIRAGELQCAALGAKVEAFDPQGRPVVGEVGELVLSEPMPSMPVYLWNDSDGRRYHDSYFDVYPDVWRHGDWIRITDRGSSVIYGRSDSTLNRAGVRMGTSEFYRVVEDVPEVTDSLVIDLAGLDEEGKLLLFVVLRDGQTLDDELRTQIANQLRSQLSPRHVPDEIRQISEVPRTLNGKKLEVPVKKILLGDAPENAVSPGALANPAALDYFIEMRKKPQRQAQAGFIPAE